MGKKKGAGRAKQASKAKKFSSPGGSAGKARSAASKKFFPNDDDFDQGTTFRGFAQRSGDSTPGRANVKLRHQAIAFVSAGTNTPAEPDSAVEEEDITVAIDEDEDIDDDEEEEEEGDEEEENGVEEQQARVASGGDENEVEDLDESAIMAAAMADAEAYIARGTKDMHLNEASKGTSTSNVVDADITMEEPARPAAVPLAEPSPPAEPSFVIDTEGDAEVAAEFNQKSKVPVRAASPTPSDSSEEIILFHGRKKATVIDDPYAKSKPQQRSTGQAATKAAPQNLKAASPAPLQQAEAHMTDDLLAALNANNDKPVTPTGWATKQSSWDKQQPSEEGFTPAPPGSWWHKKGMPRPDLGPSQAEKAAFNAKASKPRATKVGFAEPEEEDGASETIASLQADWDAARRENRRAKQVQQELEEDEEPTAADRDVVKQQGLKMSRRGKRGRKRANKLLRDLQSDDSDAEEAAYQDYVENLKTQLEDDESGIEGIVSAESGPSLVVDGQPIPENRVLDPATHNINWGESRMLGESSADSDDDTIGEDLSQIEDSEDDMNASDFDSSDLEQELEYNEREEWEDEADLRQRRIDAMDDEHIARLFAKQQALGIEGDELMIDDGAFMDMDEVEGFGDLDEARSGLASLANMSFGSSTNKRRPAKRGGRGGFSFPDASALADSVDQYGDFGFDIMDFDRPSLRNTKRGRKGKLPVELEELSDDELKEEMINQWDNDRAKKRLKKAEREELRMQGMLGAAGKKGKADLSQKYLQGMTVSQIHEELKIFLIDDGKTTRAFPPMDKHDRKSLHEIANALNLKSKSVGTGKNRAPVLYKTSRTVAYSEHTFSRITNAANRGFLKNSSFKGKKPKGPMRAPRGGRGGGGVGGTGLRDGEIVGAGAKEIGKDNFGHRLMEKMGWSKGQALGREGEGRLAPVEQVMKAGRGGLG